MVRCSFHLSQLDELFIQLRYHAWKPTSSSNIRLDFYFLERLLYPRPGIRDVVEGYPSDCTTAIRLRLFWSRVRHLESSQTGGEPIDLLTPEIECGWKAPVVDANLLSYRLWSYRIHWLDAQHWFKRWRNGKWSEVRASWHTTSIMAIVKILI